MSDTDNRSMIISARWARQAIGALAVSLICLLILRIPIALDALELDIKQQQQETNQHETHQHNNNDKNDSAGGKASLEAELESIVQQHEFFDPTDRSLAEAIISRLMVDNLTNELSTGPGDLGDAEQLIASMPHLGGQPIEAEPLQGLGRSAYLAGGTTGPETLRLKKLLSMVQAYESSLNGGPSGSGAGYGVAGLPVLPASLAATSKRASRLAGSYLQQHQNIANGNINPNGYGRSAFDFGLGKRPDTTGASSSILRLGDSLSGGGGSVQSVNQFGKRPSAHRYDFGLGKRVASSAYPRYDFGLGKRAPNGIRYDFGLGK